MQLWGKAKGCGLRKRIVAVYCDTIVGTVSYIIKEQSLRVIGLGVRPDFRRCGVARALIEYLERISVSEGVSALDLHTVKQTGNVIIFKRLGFQIIKEQLDDYSESEIYANLTP